MSAAVRLCRRLIRGLGALAAGLMFALMMITAVDVVGRYVFGSPLAGSTELIEFCLGLLIFATLPTLCARNDHVVVDLLENRFSDRFKRARDALIIPAAITIANLTLAYSLWLLGQRAARDALESEILALPVAWFLWVMAAFVFVAALAAARHRAWAMTDDECSSP